MPELSPTWSLESYFPAFGGPEYQQFVSQLRDDLDAAIRSVVDTEPLSESNHDIWAQHFTTTEAIGARLNHVQSYLGCLGAADAANEQHRRVRIARR